MLVGSGSQCKILIITDRGSGSRDFGAVFRDVAPCEIAQLHQAAPPVTSFCLIVCDVAFDAPSSIARVRTLCLAARASAVPVLGLLRDPSLLTRSCAVSTGLNTLLPGHTAPQDLVASAQTLIRRADAGGEEGVLHASVRDAGNALRSAFEAARERTPISPQALEHGGRSVLSAVKHAQVRPWLDIVRKYDDVTYQHCLLVAGLVSGFAIHVGLAPRHQALMAQTALIHDIGKAIIPLPILNKPDKLTMPEMAVMKTHASVGHGLLATQGGFDPQLLDVVRHHHEYIDGSGYPDGLKGEQISHLVRMTTICDIYAALIERRPYKPPLPSKQALSIMSEMGGKLDPVLLDTFASAMERQAI